MKLGHLKFITFGTLLYFMSCTSKEDFQGTYVGSFKNNIDSLKLDSKGNYERMIYTNDNKKIFSNNSTYQIEGGNVIFDNFLLNEDNLSPTSKYDSTSLVVANLPFTLTLSGIRITANDDLEYYYAKK